MEYGKRMVGISSPGVLMSGLRNKAIIGRDLGRSNTSIEFHSMFQERIWGACPRQDGLPALPNLQLNPCFTAMVREMILRTRFGRSKRRSSTSPICSAST